MHYNAFMLSQPYNTASYLMYSISLYLALYNLGLLKES